MQYCDGAAHPSEIQEQWPRNKDTRTAAGQGGAVAEQGKDGEGWFRFSLRRLASQKPVDRPVS